VAVGLNVLVGLGNTMMTWYVGVGLSLVTVGSSVGNSGVTEGSLTLNTPSVASIVGEGKMMIRGAGIVGDGATVSDG
jgi:hypothetical protein